MFTAETLPGGVFECGMVEAAPPYLSLDGVPPVEGVETFFCVAPWLGEDAALGDPRFPEEVAAAAMFLLPVVPFRWVGVSFTCVLPVTCCFGGGADTAAAVVAVFTAEDEETCEVRSALALLQLLVAENASAESDGRLP